MAAVADSGDSSLNHPRSSCRGPASNDVDVDHGSEENRALAEARQRKGRQAMRIMLYNPDNGITRNYMPHLWMFVLQALTPDDHEVVLVDGNTRAMDEAEIARFVREER